MQNWDNLADKYEDLQVKEDSLDTLVEFPVQRELTGDVENKCILDLACGSGRKSLGFANEGASFVLGIDKSESFISRWKFREKPDNLSFAVGDLSHLDKIPELKGRVFDIVTCFQAICYTEILADAMLEIRGLLDKGGLFIFTTAHPFRFVVEKQERFGISPGTAYRDESPYSFQAMWDDSVTLTHCTPKFSTMINSIVNSGFSILEMREPDLSEQQKTEYPHKNRWMEKYLGMVAYKCIAI